MPTKKVVKATKSKVTVEKKPAKKTAVKRVPAKTAAGKSVSKKTTKELIFADNDRSFWVTNGQILNSLIALRDALDQMEKEVYQYHAGKAQNDFALWVDAVLCDAACAADLQKAKTPKSAKTAVVKHLKTYSV